VVDGETISEPKDLGERFANFFGELAVSEGYSKA